GVPELRDGRHDRGDGDRHPRPRRDRHRHLPTAAGRDRTPPGSRSDHRARPLARGVHGLVQPAHPHPGQRAAGARGRFPRLAQPLDCSHSPPHRHPSGGPARGCGRPTSSRPACRTRARGRPAPRRAPL
ncbi:MAG: hypothetical protein AVDCRST_MAG20-1819, partial [uncultured Acidimicrobiales bacterium]